MGFAYIREPFPASNMLALMRFLACVSANVNSQGTSLNKTFTTTWGHTGVRSFICMDSIMSLKVGFSVEALWKMINPTLAIDFSPSRSSYVLYCKFANRTGKALHWARSLRAP